MAVGIADGLPVGDAADVSFGFGNGGAGGNPADGGAGIALARACRQAGGVSAACSAKHYSAAGLYAGRFAQDFT